MASMPSISPSPALPFNIQVSGRHMELGEAFRTRAEGDLTGAIGKYFDRGGSGEVRVSRDGHSVCVDIVLLLGTGQQLIARATGGDAHAALDAGVVKLEKQVRRYHRELTNHHPHNGGARSPADRAPLSEGTAAIDPDQDDVDETEAWGADGSAGNGAPESAIIAESVALKSLTPAMAAMELDGAKSPVLVFRNVAHGGVAVVYRRGDGNIGWIDPERLQTAPSASESKANGEATN